MVSIFVINSLHLLTTCGMIQNKTKKQTFFSIRIKAYSNTNFINDYIDLFYRPLNVLLHQLHSTVRLLHGVVRFVNGTARLFNEPFY